jgi:hypothetical protein
LLSSFTGLMAASVCIDGKRKAASAAWDGIGMDITRSQ